MSTPVKELHTMADLDQLLFESAEVPVLILKHSTT